MTPTSRDTPRRPVTHTHRRRRHRCGHACNPVIRDRAAPAPAPGPGRDPPSQSVAPARFPGVHPWRALSALQVMSNTRDPFARSADGMPGFVFHVPAAVTGLTGTGRTTRVAVGREIPHEMCRDTAIGIEAPGQTLVRAAIHHVIPARPSRRERGPGRSKAGRTAAIAISGPFSAFIPPLGPFSRQTHRIHGNSPVRSIARAVFHVLR